MPGYTVILNPIIESISVTKNIIEYTEYTEYTAYLEKGPDVNTKILGLH